MRQPDLLLLLQGQNEGTVMNHLQTMHYHLGLICAHCPSYFPTNAEAMHCHAHACNPTPTGIGDDNDYEEYEDNDNGERGGKDDKFKLKED